MAGGLETAGLHSSYPLDIFAVGNLLQLIDEYISSTAVRHPSPCCLLLRLLP